VTGAAGDGSDGTRDDEARRLAIEVIATLVDIKAAAATQILRKAGVDETLVRRFLLDRDASTNKKLTKREGGIMILDELARSGHDAPVVRSLIANAAEWTEFHLAADEYRARATVQKARELAGSLANADANRARMREQRAAVAEDDRKREATAILRRESDLLLAMFDDASTNGDPHRRGYLLQDLLDRLFRLHAVPVTRSFQRNEGGEQIDGAFEFEGWHYLVECRWRSKLANVRDLDGLYGQIGRSGRQTMGLFLAMNGWSEHVPELLKQNPAKCILLMEGYDLRSVLARHADLRALISAKARALNLYANPFFPAALLPTFGR
jgi:hypothetical protein